VITSIEGELSQSVLKAQTNRPLLIEAIPAMSLTRMHAVALCDLYGIGQGGSADDGKHD
jgi:hypothetical protein